MRREGRKGIRLLAGLLAWALTGAAAEPMKMAGDLENTVRIGLNDSAAYVYSYRYPQADPSDPSADTVNAFYSYLASDAENFNIPMNADYYRTQNPAEDVTVRIDYEITCNNDDFLSVLIHTRQGDLNTWTGHTFSRKGLKTGSTVALPYLLGLLKDGENDTWLQERQTARANETVRGMVWERLRESRPELAETLGEEELEYVFYPEEDFYLDAEGNPVFYLQPGLTEEGGEALTFPIPAEDILDEM